MKYITYGFNAHHEHKNHFGIIHLHVVAHVVFQGFINSDLSVDELTNKIDIPKSVKIAVYIAAPAFFGSYYGFAN